MDYEKLGGFYLGKEYDVERRDYWHDGKREDWLGNRAARGSPH
jgi:hypothetical protein